MIYFDNNATTPMDPQVRETFHETLESYGNASSVHGEGRTARRLLNISREKIAELLDVRENTLTFTSGGTEALNTALVGSFVPHPQGKHLIVSAVEHHAILETAKYLEKVGVEVSYLGVDPKGRIDLEALKRTLKPQTKMVAVMAANNETGNLYPIQAIGQIVQDHGARFLCDTVQAMGKLNFNWGELPVDFLAAGAHKFHGPKGVGFLYSREGLDWEPLLHGGRQERGRRAGTENLAGIVAMAQALELAQKNLETELQQVGGLRDRLQKGILQTFPDAVILGDPNNRLPNTVNVYLPGVAGDTALMNLDLAGVAISIGAACESGSTEPSHVLKAMGLNDTVASSGLRFSLSRFNTPQEVEQALVILKEVVQRIRQAA
jgi:cysteine desulfurase